MISLQTDEIVFKLLDLALFQIWFHTFIVVDKLVGVAWFKQEQGLMCVLFSSFGDFDADIKIKVYFVKHSNFTINLLRLSNLMYPCIYRWICSQNLQNISLSGVLIAIDAEMKQIKREEHSILFFLAIEPR
jgi:hypothetical protein